ncbi:MAG TPA: carbonic anhydrase [Nitrosomonas nitrosa]|jgi:carbonic anhydrase|uniref:carbonic anhydrase n=1 Tax=Nitrosomonas nitrosa TaxID=52442 RepID=A0A1I4QLK5_9PROT|nr:carbonic anhydrase [Nitrosomonas nitrosa]MCO6433432.1 carbonic anhydrase [Nitrosomonas nitrosa]PTQ98357.1 carbonic anhydrase [Nitrosomonas nitrosa]CAE6491635.1 Carbonic anhydrase [Nitrosomonas nitrosa]SFM40914.1 carbonic anhydrase [Nitrosomonas nitrosa]HBZ29875.1 carbonic anhydrase [Nitrosomonas nitrosa]
MCYRCAQADISAIQNEHVSNGHHGPAEPDKRLFLKQAAVTALSLGFVTAGIAADKEKNSTKSPLPSTPKPENILTPDQALERLMAGNERFVSGKSEPLDFHDVETALAKGQNPYATILGCSDSRVSPEHCFDEALGDLFVARVAGNYLTHDNLATLEYSVAVLKTPLIMVLGHESCGAVKAAIDAVDHYQDFPGHIQLLASAIAPAVRAVTDTSSNRLVNVIKTNVIMTVEKLRTKTPILDYYHDHKKIRIVGGFYHLKTGKVELIA